MADIKEIRDALSSAVIGYKSAVSTSVGIGPAKEKLKNLLFNYRQYLVLAAVENVELKKENEALNAALVDSDDEIDELRHKVRELEMQLMAHEEQQTSPKKRKTKTMTAVVE